MVEVKIIADDLIYPKGKIVNVPKKEAEESVKKGDVEYIEEQKETENHKTYTDSDIKEWKKVLKDPNLFDKMFKTELDKKIVGEIESRKVIGLCGFGGRLVKNAQVASFNLMVNDDAGVGKDYIANASLEMMPNKAIEKRTRISATVLNYWHNAEDEPLWTWDGKVLYLEDISETILNHEVFKCMCSSGSSASIVKDQKVIDLEINGKPVMIITTATATPNPELVRRFVILNLDSSVDQTKEIMKRHSEFRQKGIMPEVDSKYKFAMQFLNRVKVKIPFAEKIHNHFPHNNIIMRTHYPRFLDFISASAAFHQFQRKTEDGFVIAEGEDYNLARRCFLKLCSNRYMIPLTINQKKILEIFELNQTLEGSIARLHASHINFISDRALAYNLSLLGKYGILETKAQVNEQNKTVECYYLARNYKPNEKIEIPTFKMMGGSEGSEAGEGGFGTIKNEEVQRETPQKTQKVASLPISQKSPKSNCRITSHPSEPSTPSLPSQPSLPNNNNIIIQQKEEKKEEPSPPRLLNNMVEQSQKKIHDDMRGIPQ